MKGSVAIAVALALFGWSVVVAPRGLDPEARGMQASAGVPRHRRDQNWLAIEFPAKVELDAFLSAFAVSGVNDLRFVVASDCRERTKQEMERLVQTRSVATWVTPDQKAWKPPACAPPSDEPDAVAGERDFALP